MEAVSGIVIHILVEMKIMPAVQAMEGVFATVLFNKDIKGGQAATLTRQDMFVHTVIIVHLCHHLTG